MSADETMPWVRRWSGLIPSGGQVLDLACGNGRHAVHLAGQGHRVVAVDRDLGLSASARQVAGIEWRELDLETGVWPFEAGAYQGIVVTNYLHRPLFAHLFDALAPGGVLIYATFSMGQARHGRPRNPVFLLMPGELLEAVRGRMRVVAYEDVEETGARTVCMQRLCAIKN